MKINGIIGKKLGMSLIYDDSGNMLPVTLVQAGPCTVTQVKTLAKDGYDSVQIGFSESKNLNSPQSGHQKRSGGQFSVLQEFQADDPDQIEVGQKITTEIFEENEKIKVSGTTKGRGFSGTIKKYSFSTQRKTHGQGDTHRHVGSIGAASDPSRVFPGKKMPGRYGNKTVSVKGLEVIRVNESKNQLLVKGSVPGASNGIIYITR